MRSNTFKNTWTYIYTMIRYIRPIIYDDDDNDLTSNDRYTRYSHLNDTIVHDFLF